MIYSNAVKGLKPSQFIKLPGDYRGLGIDEFLSVCEMAELKLIILQHGLKTSRLGSRTGSSFQQVTIKNTGGRNETKFVFTTNKDFEGRDVQIGRCATFSPCGLLGSLLTIIPDTPFNRDLIAKSYGAKKPLYTVHKMTEDYNEFMIDIRKRKEEKFKDVKKKTFITENSDLKTENEELKEQMKKMQADLELARGSRDVATTLETNILAKLKHEAEVEVLNENADIINKMQIKSPSGYKQTKAYRHIANELIQERYDSKCLKYSEQMRLAKQNNAESKEK